MGFEIIDGFKVNASVAIDERFVFSSIVNRDALPVNERYFGIITVVVDPLDLPNSTPYYLKIGKVDNDPANNGNWQSLTSGSSITEEDIQNMAFSFAVDAGAANAYVISMTPNVTTYQEGQLFLFRALNTNTGTSTLNIDGVSADTIVRVDGTTLQANDIQAGSLILVARRSSQWQLIGTSGGGIVLADIPYLIEFQINSDSPVGSASIFSGHIEVDTTSEILNGRLSDANYQTSMDDGDTYVTHADLTELHTWIDANITLPTTQFQIRPVGIFTGLGEAQIKFQYKIS